jgi:L-aminopeptidase/D-esterase-like protein
MSDKTPNMELKIGTVNVPGFKMGHWTSLEARTGCTLVIADHLCPAAVDVRGGAPGTRETDLLMAGKSVQRVDAIMLAGGSAFGLSSVDGAVRWLHEHGRGFPTSATPVPIVAGAVIFDLVEGEVNWPDAEAGYYAARSASNEWHDGRLGAGTGASVSKYLGRDNAIRSGIGIAQMKCDAGLVSAVFINNAFGDVYDPKTGELLTAPGGGTLSTEELILAGVPRSNDDTNTVIGVITVNRPLDHNALTRIAVAGQAGIARSIRPAHTPADGDTVFAVASESGSCSPGDLMQLTTAAQYVVASAVSSTVAG